MTARTPPATLDDDAIGQLAADPQRPLFPLLARAEAMLPLVVVLAFLPPLYAVRHRTLSEGGAREGLISLRCLAAASLEEAVDPARVAPQNPLRFQPPLMNWLTALSLRLFGVGNATGILAPAYLCTAGLIVAGYVLARRLGGERLGLVAAGLLGFNPLILEGAQEPVPQSLACLLAALALAGTVAHWQKSANVASYQLLLAGLALGLCLLAGGPIALAVIFILVVYAALRKISAWVPIRWGDLREQSPLHRRPVIRSLAVLAATAFAVGGWHVLLMSARYGSDFWHDWWSGAAPSGDAATLARASWIMEAAWELNRLALPVFGLSLVGIVGVVRDLYRADDESARRHQGLLLVWIGAALTGWLVSSGPAAADAPGVRTWEALLAVPLVIAAALGLLEIAERRVGFLLSLAFGLLAVGGAAVMAGQFLAGSAGDEALVEFSGVHLSVRSLGMLAFLAAAGAVLARLPRGRDGRQRFVLSGMLAVIIAANCAWGMLAVRRTSPGDRELAELKSGLARLPTMDQCTFVAVAPADASDPAEPPAQLIEAIACLWPGAEMKFASSWDDAAADGQSAPQRDENATAVFVTWSPQGHPRRVAPAADLKAAAPPFHYRGLEIVAYTRERSSPATGLSPP